MKIYRNLTAMTAVAIAMTFAAHARADTVFYLSQPECPGGACSVSNVPGFLSTANSIKVDVSLVSSSEATITLTSPFTLTGPIWLNVNIPSYTDINESTSTVSISGGLVFTSGSEDQFGTFNVGTGAASATSVVFTLFTANSYTWSSDANVLKLTTGFSSFYKSVNGDPGFDVVVAHGYPGGTNAVQDAGFETPLPAALPLFATGIGGLGLLGWRRKRKAQAVA